MTRLTPERQAFLDSATPVFGEDAAERIARHPDFPEVSLVIGGLNLLRFKDTPAPSGRTLEAATIEGAVMPTGRAVREATKRGGIAQTILGTATRSVVPVQLMHIGYMGDVENTWGSPGERAFPVLDLVEQDHLVPMPELPQGYMLADPGNARSHMLENPYAIDQ